jgi:hypothetical protein
MADMEKGLKAFKETMATIVGAKLSSDERRFLGRKYWNGHKDILKSIADDELVEEHSLTDWAAAPAEQHEQRQKEHTAVKLKCVQERAALAKASRTVVDYVGNMEMPIWSNDNKGSVEAYAIELRHHLDGYHLQQRVQHPPSSVEHIRHEAPPPVKDPNAAKLEYPEETLTPEERATNILEIDDTAGMVAAVTKVTIDTPASKNDSSDNESEAEPMDVEDDEVYANRYEADMDVSGPVKEESERMAEADWEQLGETTKAKTNRQEFVRDSAKTYMKAKRSVNVRECRTGVQQRRRE